jgi:putative ABC transport system permease protein
LSRYVASILYGVEPLDPMVMALVSLTLVAVAVAAATLPALRATRVDPLVALRQE